MGWRPAIWPPTMKYLLLTSHFSDCFSGRGLASVAYNYYSQLVYYSKTFRQGCIGLTNILKAPSGRFNVFLFFKRWRAWLQMVIFFIWELDHNTRAFLRYNTKLTRFPNGVSRHFIFPVYLFPSFEFRRSHSSHEIMLCIILGPIKK